MSKFVRKSRVENQMPQRAERPVYQEPVDNELSAIERQIAALEAKKAMAIARQDRRASTHDESYYEDIVEGYRNPRREPASVLGQMRDIHANEEFNPAIFNESRINRDEYAMDDLEYSAFQPGSQLGQHIWQNRDVIASILEERTEYMKEAFRAEHEREMRAAGVTSERMARQSMVSSRLDHPAMAGRSSSDLRSDRLRATAYESEVASGYGLLDEDRLAAVEAARARMMTASCNRSKAIKRDYITDEAEVREWEDREYNKSKSVRDIYGNSPILSYLRGER